MSKITHHIPDAMLLAFAAGTLPQPFALVVASHVSLCHECRAALEAHQAAGGAVLDHSDAVDVSADLRSGILRQLDAKPAPVAAYARAGVYPGPVMTALKGGAPRWKSVGGGVRQQILFSGRSGSVRLVAIPPGQAIPEHSHVGIEATLVLQGSFSDETGQYGVGDVELGDDTLEHSPVTGLGGPCICLSATEAPLRFKSLLPRLLQPLLRI